MTKKAPVTLSKRAGLKMPVGRIRRMISDGKYVGRMSMSAPLALSAILEFLIDDIIEAAANQAKNKNKKRIVPRHIMQGIRKDQDLDSMLSKIAFANTGAMEHTRKELIKKKRGSSSKA